MSFFRTHSLGPLNLLENPEETITDAALSAGFTSLRTFNRVFEERFHIPPREYRKERMGDSSSLIHTFRKYLDVNSLTPEA